MCFQSEIRDRKYPGCVELYSLSHITQGAVRGQDQASSEELPGTKFLCWNVTTLPPDLTHLAGRTGNHQETPAWEIVCHFKLISSSRLGDVNSWKWSGLTSDNFTILMASLAILYEKRLLGYNYDEVNSLVIFIIGSGEH